MFFPMLSGCGPASFVKETPLRAQMSKITPGKSTREDVQLLLGEPLYSSAAWGAELYAGNVVRQRLLDITLPIPVGIKLVPATLLVVYGPPGIVSGVSYHGDYGESKCPNECILGDTKGLEIQSLHVLLAPSAESLRLVDLRGVDDACTLLVDVTEERLQRPGVDCGLYFDQSFMQSIVQNGYFRLEIPPGKHVLSCVTDWPWSPKVLPRPGHPFVPGKGWSVIDHPFKCAAGETHYIRLKKIGFVKCGFEPTDRSAFLSRTQHPRLIIVPDVDHETH